VTEAAFLEKAYDGAQERIEVLEERVRELHLLVAVAANGEYGPAWITTALEVLASMPSDPTLTEKRNA